MERNSLTHEAGILVVDDEIEMCRTLREILEGEGYRVVTAGSGKEGLGFLSRFRFELVICDIVMPDLGGFDLLSRVPPDVPVVMITAYASIETARKAFKRGVRDYLVKPFTSSELLLVVGQNISGERTDADKTSAAGELAVQNRQLRKILREMERFAPTDVPILIEGESGVGKELLANRIHALSERRDAPFIKINCAAIPDSLLESELFGHEKGAFTGAFESKNGIFETANGGTILLDEIGDMPHFLQAKILRVLQEFRFTKVGGRKEIHSDVRLLASTNRKLDELIREGKFREDLYHRINGVRVMIPPLRERTDDIGMLADLFVREYCVKYRTSFQGVLPETVDCLLTYKWPGNVRELKHVMERAVILANGRAIAPRHLPDNVTDFIEPHAESADEIIGTIERFKNGHIRALVLEALRACNGNRSEAAIRLNVSRKTLYNWMKRLDIKSEFA